MTPPGAVVEDVLLRNADLEVEAPNVTMRRVELQGGSIDTDVSTCAPGDDRAVDARAGARGGLGHETEGVVSYGGYTARGVEISHRGEGFRASSLRAGQRRGLVRARDPAAPGGDSHADGLQGYGAARSRLST